jgi:tetratricopeptide (TPR) repeat protein
MSGILTEVLLDRSSAGSLAERSPVNLLWTLSAARWTGRVTLSPKAGPTVVVDVRYGEFGSLTGAERAGLLAVMGWEDGSYVLDEELEGDSDLASYGAPLDMIFEGLQAHGQVANLVQRIKSRLTLYPVPTQDTHWRLRALAHPEPLTELVQACDGTGRLASAMRHPHPDMGAKLKALFYAVETHLLYPSPQPIPGEVELVYTNLRGTLEGDSPEVDRRRARKSAEILLADLSEQPTPSGEFAVVDEAAVDAVRADRDTAGDAVARDAVPNDAMVLPPAPEPGTADLYKPTLRARSSSSRGLARPASGIRKARRIKTQTELRVDRKHQAQEAARARELAAADAPPPARTRSESSARAVSRPPRRPSRSSTPARPSRAMTPPPARSRNEGEPMSDSVAAQRSHARGLKFMESGEYPQALTEFSRAAQQHPERLSYHAAVLWASYKVVPSKAATIIEKLEALYDGISDTVYDAERGRAEVQACLARIQADEGDAEEAEACYRLALEHDPTWRDLHVELEALGGGGGDDDSPRGGFLSRLVKKRR